MCFQNFVWKEYEYGAAKDCCHGAKLELLCPHDKLQLLNSKVGRAKEVGVYASQDFWLDKVSRTEDSFMYENTGDWRPPRTWTYYFI
jgi:hypothetical protein